MHVQKLYSWEVNLLIAAEALHVESKKIPDQLPAFETDIIKKIRIPLMLAMMLLTLRIQIHMANFK